jgi:uncharacterized membrane protein
MKKSFLFNGLLVVLALTPMAYLAIIWNSVPETVALHYNEKMQPDKMGDKGELWLPVGIIAIVSIAVFFLLNNISRIDPKRSSAQASSTFNKLAAGILVFMTILNFLIITSAAKGSFAMEKFLFPLLGLLFAFIGNFMNNIKPNYFAGFRLPWTLSDDDNWRRTHHLASKIWFAGGIFLVIISLFLPSPILLPVFIGLIVVMSIIPAVYSYRLFREKRNY